MLIDNTIIAGHTVFDFMQAWEFVNPCQEIMASCAKFKIIKCMWILEIKANCLVRLTWSGVVQFRSTHVRRNVRVKKW